MVFTYVSIMTSDIRCLALCSLANYISFTDLFIFMCMDVLPVCISVYHMHAWCLWRSEEDIISLGTRVIDSCEWPFDCWELNQEPLEEQSILFTMEPSLQPQLYIFFKRTVDSSPLSTSELGCLNYRRFLHVLDTDLSSEVCFAIIFYSVTCISTSPLLCVCVCVCFVCCIYIHI